MDNRFGRAAGLLALVAGLARCGSVPAAATLESGRGLAPTAARPAGPDAAVDPGAARLLEKVAQALETAGRGAGGLTSIRLGPLRNQSHAGAAELEGLTARLAGLLNRAGRDHAIRFFTDPSEAVDYELRGTVYLITAQGFDQWELYLSLRPAGEGWSLWRTEGPVRLLRLPAAGPQIFLPR